MGLNIAVTVNFAVIIFHIGKNEKKKCQPGKLVINQSNVTIFILNEVKNRGQTLIILFYDIILTCCLQVRAQSVLKQAKDNVNQEHQSP